LLFYLQFTFVEGIEGCKNVIHGFLWTWVIFVIFLYIATHNGKDRESMLGLHKFYSAGYAFPQWYYILINFMIVGVLFYNESWISGIVYIISILMILIINYDVENMEV